jgi:GH24 family phage-related lysozyme (muramidase)
MTYDELSGSVKLSEGFKDHVYMDTEGFRTIGWGHKVVHEDNFVDGKTYSQEELQEVFDKDLNKAIGLARQLMEENDVRDLPTTAQHTLTEMVYQLGKSGVSKFRNMWKALQEGNFIGASYEMLDSKWNKQTPNRCKKLADQMKSCA